MSSRKRKKRTGIHYINHIKKLRELRKYGKKVLDIYLTLYNLIK